MTLVAASLEGCWVGRDGGGVYVSERNHDLCLSTVHFTETSAIRSGGGLFLGQDNMRAVLSDVTVSNVEAGMGGLAYLEKGNHNFVLARPTVQLATAERGSLLYLSEDNTNATVSDVTLAGTLFYPFNGLNLSVAMRVSDVGGIFLGSENHQFTLGGVSCADYRSSLSSALCAVIAVNDDKTASSALLAADKVNNHITVERLDVPYCANDADACIGLNYGNENFNFVDSVMHNGTHKATVLQIENRYATFRNVTVRNFRTGQGANPRGAGFAFVDDNVYVTVQDCLMEDNGAASRGGAIDLGARNDYFLINNTVMRGNIALSGDKGGGSALSVRLDMGHFLIVDSVFEGNYGSHAIDMNSFVNDVVFKNVTFLNNLGGAVSFRQTVTGLELLGCDVSGNSAMWNLGKFTSETVAEVYTSGVTLLGENNADINVTDCVFRSNRAGGNGTESEQLIADKLTAFKEAAQRNASITFDETKVTYGGGLYLGSKSTMTLLRTVFEDNSAGFGGGLYIGMGCTDVLVRDCLFDSNFALLGGGGMYVESGVMDLHVVSSVITNNHVIRGNGGGFYSQSGLQNLLFVDSHTYREKKIVESDHPYTSKYFEDGTSQQLDVINPLVSFPGAVELYIAFDSETETWLGNDVVRIWKDETKSGEVFFENSGEQGWPGIDMNILTVPGDSVYFEFIGPDGRIVLQSGFWGFRARVLAAYTAAIDDTSITTVPVPTMVINNSAVHGDGGGLYFFETCRFPLFANVRVADNKARNGGGMYLDTLTVGMEAHNMTFSRNVGLRDGGGVALSASNYAVRFARCEFDDNQAGVGEESIVTGTGNGAGVSILSNNGNGKKYAFDSINLIDSVFRNNMAKRNGGGLFAFVENVVTLLRCTFENNIAFSAGGAVHADRHTELFVLDSTFTANSAVTRGGALSLAPFSAAELTNCDFILNTAGPDPSWAVSQLRSLNETVTIESTLGTLGNGGGAIFATSALLVMGGDLKFISNSAAPFGGAMNLVSMDMFTLLNNAKQSDMLVQGNTAIYGSALAMLKVDFSNQQYFNSTSFSDLINGGGRVGGDDDDGDSGVRVILTRNNAILAGTVFWIAGLGEAYEPSGLWMKHVDFQDDNSASYGPMVATQSFEFLVASSFPVDYYGVAPPHNETLFVQLVDYYGQLVIGNNFTTTNLELEDFEWPKLSFRDCGSIDGRFNEYSTITLTDGAGYFDGLVPSCAADTNMTVTVTARGLIDPSAVAVSNLETTDVERDQGMNTDSSVRKEVSFFFRDCYDGEVLQAQECVLCIYSYSLKFEMQDECDVCPEEADECYSNEIILKEGYWRYSYDTDYIYECDKGANSCAGGYGVGDYSCNEGYSGPMCDNCMEGYFEDGDECVSCDDTSLSPGVIIACIIFSICALAVSAWFYFTLVIKKAEKELKDRQAEIGMVVKEEEKSRDDKTVWEKIAEYVRVRFFQILTRVKIITSTYQVITAVPMTFNIQFPKALRTFVSTFDLLNLDFINMLPLSCAAGTFNYTTNLVVTTLTAPALVGLVMLMKRLELVWRMKNRAKQSTKHLPLYQVLLEKQLNVRYLNVIMLILYMALPSVTLKIFEAFVCVEVRDENGTVGSYLDVDKTISCNSAEYNFISAWAIIMLFFYPMGIPYFYYHTLRKRSEAIKALDVKATPCEDCGGVDGRQAQLDRDAQDMEELTEEEKKKLLKDDKKDDLYAVAFLFQSYKGIYWYWEVVEATRRLMLTAVLSIIQKGHPSQVVFAMLLAVGYVRIYSKFMPYKDPQNAWLAEVGQYQIFFTFFGTLIIKENLLGSQANAYVGILMILLQTSFVFVTFYFEYCEYKDREAMLRKREIMMMEKKEREALEALENKETALPSWMLIQQQKEEAAAAAAADIHKERRGQEDDEDEDEDEASFDADKFVEMTDIGNRRKPKGRKQSTWFKPEVKVENVMSLEELGAQQEKEAAREARGPRAKFTMSKDSDSDGDGEEEAFVLRTSGQQASRPGIMDLGGRSAVGGNVRNPMIPSNSRPNHASTPAPAAVQHDQPLSRHGGRRRMQVAEDSDEDED